DIADGPDGGWLPTADAIAAAAAVGVTRIVQIGCDLPGARWAVEAAGTHDALVAGVALHPNEAPGLDATGQLDAALAEIEALAASGDRVRAVGETGLDYFRTGEDGRAAQHRSFRAHIALAKRLDKTLVIHDRDAHDDVLRILDEEGVPDRFVMHCFSGDAAFARACLDRGGWLSFAGTVTFKNAEPLREALRAAPADRILVETDAPYLTPMPYRGRPNASYLVPLTMRAMAEARGEPLAELCAAVDANTDAAFGGQWGTQESMSD
ncbi:MAG: TatD family hydrolase, partial [Nocardioidaceae bacterium]